MKTTHIVMLALTGVLCRAQTPEPATEPQKFYRLDFVIKDLEGGKVVTAHNYSMILASGEFQQSEIRAGSKVPVGGTNVATLMDVGTNIDCARATELHDELSFNITVDVSSLLSSETESRPIIRQNRWLSHVTVPLKKATIVFSSDDSTTKRVMQLEVTATPIK